MKSRALTRIPLLILMCLAATKTFAHNIAVANSEGVTIYYTFINNHRELAVSYRGTSYSNYSNEYQGSVVIPEFVTYEEVTYPVTAIGDNAFEDCFDLTSIIIPNSVTSIGNSAFFYCRGLTSITLPNSVTFIGWMAFCNCSGLTSITIPNSVTSISSSVFSGCSGLTYVTIPNSVTSIGEHAFYGCSGLTSVTIPNSVTSIGYSAFYGCRGLTSISIPNSVTCIGSATFHATSWYDSQPDGLIYVGKVAYSYKGTIPQGSTIVLEEGTLGIAGRAFANCSGLTSITIPNSVTNIGHYAFEDCSGLTSITIPNSVSSIGDGAFYGCSGLTSITIPNNVKSIGDDIFFNCTELQSVIIGNGVTNLPSRSLCTGNNLKSLTIGSGMLSIASDAFRTSSSSTSVYKPIKTIWLTNTPPEGYTYASGTVNYVANENYTSLTKRTTYPFLSSMFEVDGVKYVPVSPSERTCDAIDCVYDNSAENVHIGETVSYKGIALKVQQIKPYACYGNSYIKNIDLSLEGDVGVYAFNNCMGVTIADLANKGKLADDSFRSCTSLHTVTFGDGVTSLGWSAFRGCSALETVTLGNGLTSLPSYAFEGCKSLQSIEIPNSVESLGTNIFQNCTSLTSVKMGSGAKSIEAYTFSGCSKLTDMQIGSNVASIGTYAFSGCSSLSSIKVPQAVTTINDYAFTECLGLKDVIIADRESELTLGCNGDSPLFASCPLDSVYIGGNITYPTASDKGYSPFCRNRSLRTVVITDKETEVSENEFYGCTKLQSFTVGNGVTSFGNWAFSGCSSLKSLAFGTQLQSIGKEAFSDCTEVTKIVSKAATPPACGSQALDDINKWNCNLYLPTGSMSAYQAADQWKEFFFAEEGDGGEGTTTPEQPEDKKCATPTISYIDGELTFGCETEGVEYVYEIRYPNRQSGRSEKAIPSNTFTIKVYATKAGCEDSEPVSKEIQLSGGILGDMTGDGEVSVSDVTKVIDIILNKKE